MKKAVMVLAAGMMIIGMAGISYASDWDKAGKALTVIEGLRVVTGGKMDLIGNIFGFGRETGRPEHAYSREPSRVEYVVYEADRCPGRGCGNHYGHQKFHRQHFEYAERVWVPHYVWSEEYVPAHSEYRDGYEIYVPGHYVSVKLEEGGHWETRYVKK